MSTERVFHRSLPPGKVTFASDLPAGELAAALGRILEREAWRRGYGTAAPTLQGSIEEERVILWMQHPGPGAQGPVMGVAFEGSLEEDEGGARLTGRFIQRLDRSGYWRSLAVQFSAFGLLLAIAAYVVVRGMASAAAVAVALVISISAILIIALGLRGGPTDDREAITVLIREAMKEGPGANRPLRAGP